ncbi:hypothetical protein CHARACLAT_014442 [Characodon lateralis]|uniref:BED-type domain-containing protein n=1 Tax=Characodon lateralis TaxID=208331 RepID=A0ABU7D0Z8_9TELE|nr:hypothetical protein [Characodon lateralis]
MEGEDETTGEDIGEHLVSKKKNNGSLIWRWFGFKISDEQQKDVFCREYTKQVLTKSSSTTNLFNHLKQCHKKEYEECVKLRAAAQTVKPSQPPAPKQTT